MLLQMEKNIKTICTRIVEIYDSLYDFNVRSTTCFLVLLKQFFSSLYFFETLFDWSAIQFNTLFRSTVKLNVIFICFFYNFIFNVCIKVYSFFTQFYVYIPSFFVLVQLYICLSNTILQLATQCCF